jgi:hypothetical protein
MSASKASRFTPSSCKKSVPLFPLNVRKHSLPLHPSSKSRSLIITAKPAWTLENELCDATSRVEKAKRDPSLTLKPMKFGSSCAFFREHQIGVDHDLDQFFEADFGLPAENLFCFGWVTNQ